MSKGKEEKNIYLGKDRGGESDNTAPKPAAFT